MTDDSELTGYNMTREPPPWINCSIYVFETIFLNYKVLHNIGIIDSYAKYLFAIILIVLFLTGCTGNILVITLIHRCRHLRGAPAMLLANLSVADLLVCIVYFPFYLYIFLASRICIHNSEFVMINVLQFIEFLSPLCSVLTLIAINIERYYVVKFPLRVRTVITFRRKLLVIASIWLISILCSCNIFIKIKEYISIHDGVGRSAYTRNWWIPITQIYIPAVILIASCVVTTTTLCKRIHCSSVHGVITSSNISPSSGNSLIITKKAIKTVIIVTVVFLCMTLPNAVARYFLTKTFLKVPQYPLIELITNILRLSNSCINPFIYALVSRSFRLAVKLTFCKRTAQQNRS
ncbi:QRFP-like peptide receptor [Anneissia japonica]|uniref:QRFP-like peptide receptor n=1 Tax=Anneissia japonica TaxID=1529436 RepID=UPI0014256C9A|nr:QRFP-like peptide receptor [Anneissia japonica]